MSIIRAIYIIKCQDKNPVDVCCSKFKELVGSNVCYLNISSTFLTHIVSHNAQSSDLLQNVHKCHFFVGISDVFQVVWIDTMLHIINQNFKFMS